MNPMQSPNVGPGGRDFGNRNRFKFRVHYEIPPTRAVRTAEYEELGVGTGVLRKMLKEDNPTWRILGIERGIKQV